MAPHPARPAHDVHHPVHVALRAARGLPSLRSEPALSAMRPALTAACPATFRVVHFSVQTGHVHMIVEVGSGAALRRGLQVFARRAARALNRAWGRSGDVWGDRYQACAAGTPREVRNGLLPVLLTLRKRAARSIRPAA